MRLLLPALVLAAAASAAQPDFSQVPGVVITHSPASSGQYIGSPGIVVLPNGHYLAKCDLFGPKSTENSSAVTRVFRSTDKGRTWSHVTDVQGMYWANIFLHRKALYLLGPEKQYGNLLIRRSDDGGSTWTEPTDENSGLLREGRFHTAPVPVVIHQGRLWRAFESADGPGGWGSLFRAFVMSSPEKADLLKRGSWTFTNSLDRDPLWLNGEFGGWLEGNAVVTPGGRIVDILRADTKTAEKAAIVEVSTDGTRATFDPRTGFIDFPGGAKKFTIRYDRKSKFYWSLANVIPPRFAGRTKPASVRNTLALIRSRDLRNWEIRATVLSHPDPIHHGFQYVDWLFEGNDLIVACRTAFDDGLGGAHNNHDANFLTFHRVRDFRTLVD